MTPEERNLINELFDRIATLENAQRDPAAEQAIYDGFQRAPNAAYALVQTVLVRDEVLKRAEARIRELEAAIPPDAPRDTSFLGGMRESLGFGEPRRSGSVPSVKPGMSSAWRNTGTPSQGEPMPASGPMSAPMTSAPMSAPPMASGGMGGSFLGTAAAAAAGVVGGSLLMGGLRSMMGGGGHAHSAFDPSAGAPRSGSPWSGGSEGGDLSRQAGLEDMGRASGSRGGDDNARAGLFDTASRDPVADGDSGDYDGDAAAFTDDGGDFGGGDGGGDGGGGE